MKLQKNALGYYTVSSAKKTLHEKRHVYLRT